MHVERLFDDDRWNACLSDFLDSVEDRSGSKKSRIAYASRLRAFFTDPSRSPDAYSSSEVKAFLNARSIGRRNHGGQVKPQTKNAKLTTLCSWYKWASQYEIDGQPLLTTKAPTFGVRFVNAPPSPRAMSERELALLMSAIPDDTEKTSRDRALISFFWWTGRRLSEVQRLTWGDLEQTVVCDPDGARRPAVSFHFKSKGKSRMTQTAELPAPSHKALLHYLRIAGRLDSMQADSPLFTSIRGYNKGNAPLNIMRINEIFKEHCRSAGLSPEYSVHSLRHTAARLRYEAGQDIISIKDFLGHSNLETTYRYLQCVSSSSDSFALQLEQKFAFLTH